MATAAGEASRAPVLTEAHAADLVYAALAIPLCIVDGQGCLVAMNPAAEQFWGVRADDVVGTRAADVLGIRPLEQEGEAVDPLARALEGADHRLACRITTRDGLTHSVSLVGTRLQHVPYVVLGVVAEQAPPAWAFTDPATGLSNRLAWEQEHERWAGLAGAAILFDLDDLKEINDLHGHPTGDRVLAVVGEAIRACAPRGGLTLRYGGDEFLVLLPGVCAEEAEAWSQRVSAWVAQRGAAALPVRPSLCAGCASFAPGSVDAAIQRADDALYERKGVLLRAASGSRLVLTREGQRSLRTSLDPPPVAPAAYATRFTAAFDAHFREALARASEQAKRFVSLVAPSAGSAVVEVGAGSGRITFDGGLAACVGPTGQLLVTDPSEAQLQIAQRRAVAAGCPWIRFLPAPAEVLPVAAGCVDLVLGAVFLHFTDPVRAISEMARILRPGGTLALSAPLPFPWPPYWEDMLQPVREEAERLGLPHRHVFVPEERIRTALSAAGLRVERSEYQADLVAAPRAAIAQTLVQQIQGVALMLRGAPIGRIHDVEQRVVRRMAEEWDAYPAAERECEFSYLNLVARKP